jgi:hypothetical protein
MNCVILQPSYIPWRGYFHQIYKADIFVFYDDVQYDKNGWRNRNRIKTSNGSHWLTIPVKNKGIISEHLLIKDVQIDWSKDWMKKHWSALAQAYARAPYFSTYADLLKSFYDQKPVNLADYTISITIAIAQKLGIERSRFVRSSSLQVSGEKTDRLIQILQKLNTTHYISGPAARDYLEEEKLAKAGISLEYMSYDYPEYPQLYPPFDPFVSIVDLLLMTGPQAPDYIWTAGGHRISDH